MKSTSFCLNYASSVSFLNLFPREAITWFCVKPFESQSPVLLPKSPTLIHASFVGELMKASYKEGGKALSLQQISLAGHQF